MITLSDLIYNFYLNDTSDKFIKSLYEKDTSKFMYYLGHNFYLPYQKQILDRINVTQTPSYTQNDIDEIFKDYSLLFHKHVNKEYLYKRNITDEQISEFKIGSNHIIKDSIIMKSFHVDMLSKHNPEIYVKITDYFNNCMKSTKDLYNNDYFSTFPSFDSDNNCYGIIMRSQGYVESDTKIGRNVSKYFDTHAPSYIFDMKTFNKYDELILVEGVFDVLTMKRFGYDNVITTSGIKLSEYHWEQLKNKKLHIIYDGDIGGFNALRSIKERYNPKNVTYNILPNNYDDIDDFGNKEPENFCSVIDKMIYNL